MAVATYNVCTLPVKGKNGYGHGEHVLAKGRQLGCYFIDLQETRRSGSTAFSAVGYQVSCQVRRKQQRGKDQQGCTELA